MKVCSEEEVWPQGARGEPPDGPKRVAERERRGSLHARHRWLLKQALKRDRRAREIRVEGRDEQLQAVPSKSRLRGRDQCLAT